jgi:hypothetical protein
MTRTLIGAVLLAALTVTGCGAADPAGQTSTAPVSSTPAGSPSTGGGADGCSSLSEGEVARYALWVQVFPQVTRQSVIDSVRGGTITDYTPEAFAATLAKLEFLRGAGVEGLGDPGASLDYYARVNAAMATLLAQPDPVPQSAIDAYRAAVGTVAESLSKQVAINAALAEVCPDLL